MKLAVTVWNGRVSPVFDTAHTCLIADSSGRPASGIDLPSGSGSDKAVFLEQQGIAVLVCGAISSECEEAVISKGIEVISFTAGPIATVLQAWRENRLVQTSFSMPGCGCPRRRCRHRSRQPSRILKL